MHEDHRQEQDHIRQIGQQRGAEGINGRGDETADEGSEQAADTAEDDHDQRERQHVRVQPGVGGHDGSPDHAARSGESGAETKHGGEQPRHWNAHRPRHLHVVDAGANHRAEPRALHQQMQRDRRRRSRCRARPAGRPGKQYCRRRAAVAAKRAPAIGIGSPPQTMRQRSAMMNEMPSVTSTCPSAFPAKRPQNEPLEQPAETRQPAVRRAARQARGSERT